MLKRVLVGILNVLKWTTLLGILLFAVLQYPREPSFPCVRSLSLQLMLNHSGYALMGTGTSEGASTVQFYYNRGTHAWMWIAVDINGNACPVHIGTNFQFALELIK